MQIKKLFQNPVFSTITIIFTLFIVFSVVSETVDASWCGCSSSNSGRCGDGKPKFQVFDRWVCYGTPEICMKVYKYCCNCSTPGPVDPNDPNPPPPPPPQPCSCSAPATPTITSPANGAQRINPDKLVVTWTMGGWGVDSGYKPNCRNSTGNDSFYLFYRKVSGDTSDAAPATPPGVLAEGWRRITVGRSATTYTIHNLDGGSTYEIYLRANNGCSSRNTGIRTITTSKRPIINSLTINATCPADSGGTYWSGIAGSNSKVTNPANFTSSMTDPEGIDDLSYAILQIDADANDPETNYRYLKAMYVRSRSGYTNDTFYLWDNNQWKDTITSGAIDGAHAKIHIGANASRARQSGQDLIIDWNIEFENTFAQAKHNAYLFISDTTGAQDQKTGTVTRANVNSSNPAGDAFHQLPNLPVWGVDTTAPSVIQPVPAIIDANTLDISWSGSDALSRPRRIDGFCWQNGGGSTSIIKVTPLPRETKKLDLSDPDPDNNPDTTSNCFASLTTNTTIRYDLTQAVGDISSYNFKSKVIDNACNVSTTNQSLSANSPWIMTYGNNLHTANLPISIPYISINSLFTGTGGTVIAKTEGDSFASTYTNSSTGTTIPLRASRNSFTITTYNDFNIKPPAKADIGSYYEYLYDIVSSNITLKNIPASAFSGKTSMSSVDGAGVNTFASYAVQGDLTVADPTPPRHFSCDTRSIVFVDGNLTIDPDFIISGNDNGCIFIVKGDIIVTNGDYKNSGNTNINALARYDRLEAFLVSDGTFITQEDTIGNYKWDGLLVRGTVITQGIDLQRDLRLLNNISGPSEGIVYDPRYISLEDFRNAFRIKDFSIREEGYDR
ncbi:fibronectin type III domain-containing protein [Candidatus Dojkabacteria bacterium]|nr:fibronectin type III domain-containing protein [Candidatus Dojkabacteria bacterium]